jgi:hypothetical protein
MLRRDETFLRVQKELGSPGDEDQPQNSQSETVILFSTALRRLAKGSLSRDASRSVHPCTTSQDMDNEKKVDQKWAASSYGGQWSHNTQQ